MYLYKSKIKGMAKGKLECNHHLPANRDCILITDTISFYSFDFFIHLVYNTKRKGESI